MTRQILQNRDSTAVLAEGTQNKSLCRGVVQVTHKPDKNAISELIRTPVPHLDLQLITIYIKSSVHYKTRQVQRYLLIYRYYGMYI